MGRVASGVRGIRLREGDIASAWIRSEGDEILVVTEKGLENGHRNMNIAFRPVVDMG